MLAKADGQWQKDKHTDIHTGDIYTDQTLADGLTYRQYSQTIKHSIGKQTGIKEMT